MALEVDSGILYEEIILRFFSEISNGTSVLESLTGFDYNYNPFLLRKLLHKTWMLFLTNSGCGLIYNNYLKKNEALVKNGQTEFTKIMYLFFLELDNNPVSRCYKATWIAKQSKSL